MYYRGGEYRRFQSTPPSREATCFAAPLVLHRQISIHAPLTGGDTNKTGHTIAHINFNPRPPHGRRPNLSYLNDTWQDFNPRPLTGGDHTTFEVEKLHAFQSTPPSREATSLFNFDFSLTFYFNPRPPHGRRPKTLSKSLHKKLFQSTPPSREATRKSGISPKSPNISIHAPLTGGDLRFIKKPPCFT